MIRIFVVHNNEQERLRYLLPKLRDLLDGLNQAGKAASLELVGPDADLIRQNQYRDSFVNKIRRGMDASSMSFFYAFDKPGLSSPAKELVRGCRRSFDYLFRHRRSVRIEQEVLYAHAHCWRKSSESKMPALVLESDAVLRPFTKHGLLALLDHIESNSWQGEKYYVDLAGGCDRGAIFNSWCFESEYGCRNDDLQVTPEIRTHLLPRLTANTVGGYLVSAALASELFSNVMTQKPVLPPDWAIMAFAASSESVRSSLCLHTTPTLFTQGSSSGEYVSGIDPLPRSSRAM
jgi:hypothetical protein